MAHTYMKFDFGTDEDLAQQARHKLEVWKQAFRLDKKLQYKLDRVADPGVDAATDGDTSEGELPTSAAKAKQTEKAHAKSKPEAKAKGKSAEADNSAKSDQAEHEDGDSANSDGGNVTLLVRLYFSSHEKLSEQRWFDRIPTEEPFKSAHPKVIRAGDPEFDDSVQHFSELG